jgi:hypothetical protein
MRTSVDRVDDGLRVGTIIRTDGSWRRQNGGRVEEKSKVGAFRDRGVREHSQRGDIIDPFDLVTTLLFTPPSKHGLQIPRLEFR